jgi:uncharacterized repeat protein (TIGR02543 family)
MRRVLSVFIVLSLVLSLCTGILASVPKARAATSWYVDDSAAAGGDGTTAALTGANCAFQTIGAGVAAASSGDTINVAAGTYPENVTVNKALYLVGASSATVTVTSAVDTDSVFTVAANNVTISGFTARHTTMTGNDGYAGIKFASGVTGCSIHDNILVNNQYGILLSDPENTTTPGNNTFTSNTASSNGVSGIEMQHSYGNTFTTNTVNSNGSYGFRLDGVSHNAFTSNTANSNTVNGFSLVKGSSTGGCLNNTFTSNTANLNTQYGFREDNGDHNTLTGNTFDHNVLAGLRLKEVITNLTVDHNNITNSPFGIDVAAPVTNVTTWTVEHNNISGNTTGVSNLGTGSLNAAQNWWGNASGPHNDTSNPSGTGDAVSDNVTFCQWALSSAMTTFNTLAVTTASLPTGTSGVLYSQSLQGSGGMLPYTWTVSAGSLPNGLTLTTGTISGTPTVPGVFPFTVKLTSVCEEPTKALTITVNPVITASAGTGGTIAPTGAVTVVRGADRTFAIAASTGYSVLDVVVDGVSQGARSSYTFTNVTANHTIAATFVPGVLSYVIAASATSGGSISPSGNVSVAQFGSQSFTITPTTGYRIVDVVVDAVSKGALASYTFTDVAAYHTIAASFAINTYTIVASAGSGGSISPSGNVVVYHGSSRPFTITPSTGYHVLDVLVDGVTGGAVTTYTFTNVTAAHTIAATFAINTYTLTYTAGANGTISGTSPQTVNHGASGTAVTAVPSTGYHFVQWSDTTTANPRADTNVTVNVSVTAAFAADAYTLTVTPAPVNGTVTKDPDQVTYAYGTSVTLTATPAFGYAFTGWSGDLTGTTNPTTITMNANKTVTATFAVAPPRILTITVTGSGFVVKSPNLSSYPSGTVVTLTATPLAGHAFTGWSGDLTGTTNPTTLTMDADKTVTATFAPIPSYTLTTTASPSLGGTIGKSPNLSSYPSGTVVTLTATPASGYAFTGWSGDLTGSTNPTTITMTANKTVTATFTAVFSFPLSLSADWNLISVPVPLPVASIPGFQAGYGYHNDWSVLLSTDSLVPGEGYWVQVEHAVVISLTGTPGTAPVPLTYLTGWQLLGNPFDVPVPITSITNHDLITACYSYGPTWDIVDLTTGILQPGKGCWIQLSSPTTLTLMHP